MMVSQATEPLMILTDYERRLRLREAHLPGVRISKAPVFHGIGFRLGRRLFLAEMGLVREILRVPKLWSVPGAKPWILGLANVRGRLLPINHLCGFLFGEPYRAQVQARILVTEHDNAFAGLLVDEAFDIKHFFETQRLDGATDEQDQLSDFVTSRFAAGSQQWHAFDIARLLKRADFLQAAA